MQALLPVDSHAVQFLRVNSNSQTARTDLRIRLASLFSTFAVYSNVGPSGFVAFDVKAGVSAGLKWALTAGEDSNWLPPIGLSFLLEYPIFRQYAGGYRTNLALHALASALLFVFLLRAANARRPFAFVAFPFALHPLQVESVAWVAERKDFSVRCSGSSRYGLGSTIRSVPRAAVIGLPSFCYVWASCRNP